MVLSVPQKLFVALNSFTTNLTAVLTVVMLLVGVLLELPLSQEDITTLRAHNILNLDLLQHLLHLLITHVSVYYIICLKIKKDTDTHTHTQNCLLISYPEYKLY